MRILHLDSGREMRGGQWQAIRLLEALRTLGHHSLLMARESGPLFRKAKEEGFETRPLNIAELARQARNSEVVHAHDSRSHTLAAIACAHPLVVSRRVAFTPAAGTLGRCKYARAERFIAVSNFVAGTLTANGIPGSRIEVVYDGVPLTGNYARKMPPVERRGSVLIPFSADPLKRVALAQRAAECAGQTPLISRDLERDLPGASMLVYLTDSEGLGSAALLAMSHGIPVIATRTGGLPEVVADADSGLLVENELEPVSAAIRQLVSHPERAAAMGRRGRDIVEARFTVGHMAEATVAVYRMVTH